MICHVSQKKKKNQKTKNKKVFKLIFEVTTENMKIIFFFFIKLQQNPNFT